MASNLAAYFADHDGPNDGGSRPGLTRSTSSIEKGTKVPDNDDDDMGPSVSMAVQADDDEGFQRSTFNLKRTRSMGYFDDYIDPTKKVLGKSTSPDNDAGATDGKQDDTDSYDDDDDDYNTDSDSEEDSYSDEEEDIAQTRGVSPSVSPPPADSDPFLMPQDDNDLVREPERHVDYLSHEWNEWDISKSWKYIILKKKKRAEDLVNAARLENASWRTWAKARNHLKTVSPEIVNWSKDSDVTWLYGPIMRDQDEEEASDIERGYGSDNENSKRVAATKKVKKSKSASSVTPKPILKKRTVSEILAENSEWKLNEARKHISEMKHASVVMDPYGGDSHDVYDDYDALAAKVNAQYYRHDNSQNQKGMSDSQIIDSNSAQGVPHSHSNGYDAGEQYSASQENLELGAKAAANAENTSSVPSTFATLKSNLKSAASNRARHIHFNDRVEQCMALTANQSESDYSDDEDGSDYRSAGSLRSNLNNQIDSSDDNVSSSSSDESDENDDNAGLFINPTISRKAELNNHLTDSSSQNSSVHSKSSISPIIKLLPATTLNYGSDEEASDSEEYNGGYGNAVSHNVNTYRGYDYMYDYNSVYTGDTSNFLPGEGCDVVDVPDDLDLRAAMAADNASTYEMGHAVSSSHGDYNNKSDQAGASGFMYDSPRGSDDESDEQFIENSNYRSSDDDDDGLSIKRTVSLGKSGKSSSLRDLKPVGASSAPIKTHSFITGKTVETDQKESSKSKTTARGTTHTVRPRCLKRNSSSSSFIFNSDSEEEDEQSDEDEDEQDDKIHNIQGTYHGKDPKQDENVSSGKDSRLPTFKSVKSVQPQGTMISSDPQTFTLPGSSQLEDNTSSIRLKNSSSLAEVGASDVAITGSFSPRSDSVKSVVSNKGIVDKDSSNELREMNEHLKAYHLDDKNGAGNEDVNESIHKMMQNARGIAHKYLHSWKNQDNRQDNS